MRNTAIAISVLAIFGVACDDEPTATTAPPPNARPVSVRIEGPTQVTQPAEVQFTAVQTWSDGSTRDVTASAQWTSTNPSVLSISAGLAKTLAGGEVGLTARVDPLISQPRSVRVMPAMPEWDGRYTLSISAGACSSSLPLPTELRQRTYTALVRQISLTLDVTVPGVGTFVGQILNPQVRFTFLNAGLVAERVQRASSMKVPQDGIRFVSYRRAAYWAPVSWMFIEPLPDSSRLVFTGEAITTMSPSGFTGTLNGAISRFESSRPNLLGVCSSSSHGFTLVRN